MKYLLPAMVLAIAVPTGADACGPAEVCDDTAASLIGSVLIDGLAADRVRLTWSTDDEQPGTVRAYQVSRCISPASCQPIAVVLPVGSCAVPQRYEVTDQPPAPVDAWFYRLDVMHGNGSVLCSVEVVPE